MTKAVSNREICFIKAVLSLCKHGHFFSSKFCENGVKRPAPPLLQGLILIILIFLCTDITLGSPLRTQAADRSLSPQLVQWHSWSAGHEGPQWRQILLGDSRESANLWNKHDVRHRYQGGKASCRRLCKHAWGGRAQLGAQSQGQKKNYQILNP